MRGQQRRLTPANRKLITCKLPLAVQRIAFTNAVAVQERCEDQPVSSTADVREDYAAVFRVMRSHQPDEVRRLCPCELPRIVSASVHEANDAKRLIGFRLSM